jgi:hypothetical protein
MGDSSIGNKVGDVMKRNVLGISLKNEAVSAKLIKGIPTPV